MNELDVQVIVNNARSLMWLAGGGSTGALIRSYDWKGTPLGPPEAWPQPLKTLVGIMLGSNQPMFVAWGETRTLLYNEPYAEVLAGKHPSAMGRDFLDVWHEIRSDLVPVVDQAYRGEPVQMDDMVLFMERKGFREETHFSFFYSPVRHEDGDEVAGLFCACTEITAQVLAERRAGIERERQRLMLQQMPGFAAMLSGPEHRFEYVNDAYVELAGQREFIGRTVREVFPELEGQGFFELLDRVYATGEPFASGTKSVRLANRDGERFTDLLYHPIRGDDGRVAGIFAGGYDVTKQVLTGQELRASEARFRAVQETSLDGFMLLDSLRGDDGHLVDFRWAYVNEAAARIIGRDRDWFIGRRLLEEMPGNREEGLFDVYARVVETGEPWVGEISYRHEGLDVYIRLAAARVGDGFAVSFADQSERRRAEEREQEAAERLQLALDAGAIVGTWVWETTSNRFTADERFARSFGLDPERCRTGLPIEEVVASIHDEDRLRVANAIAEALARGGPYRCQYRVRQYDGVFRWIEANGRVELAADRTPLRFPGVLLDIHERRAVEAERDRAMTLLRTFIEAVPGVVYAKDREGRMLVANHGTTALIGKPPELYLGKTDADFLDDKAQARVLMANDQRIMESGQPEQVEEEVRLPDGTPAVWLSTKAPLRDNTGAIIGLIGSSVDITARRRAEAALRESEAKFQAITNSIDQMIWSTRPDGYHDYYNDRWYEYTGVPIGSTDGEAWNGMFHPDDQERAWRVWQHSLSTGEPYHIEYRLRHRSGQYRWVIGRAQCVRDGQGRITRWYGTCTEIHDLKTAEDQLRHLNETLEARVDQAIAEREQAEEALRQSQKLESMGQLTGGVAHDFNNLLTPIVGGLDMLQRRGVGDARAQRLVEGALQSAERAKTLVQRLLAFARRQPLQPVAVDVARLVEGMADLVASTSGPRVKMTLDLAPDLPAVKADPNQLEMAILNLAVNARDAMPDGGQLTIAAAEEAVRPGHGSKLAPGSYVRLSVSDTGVGMDEATLKRAIEPFFSIKGIGKGTGLGLSMVHGLTAQLGGALTIQSKRAVGTSVELWLPIAEAVPDAQEKATELASLKAGTALLVDDDDLVRASTAEMLMELGYSVIETPSAEEAMAKLEGGLRPDLLVTDHLMPGMTGTDLARALRVKRPGLPVLIISGYAEDDGIAPDLPRLTKPFRQVDLAASLAELTGEQPMSNRKA